MTIRPTTPESLGPELVSHLGDLISRAEAAEGTPALGAWAEELSIHYRALAICVFADDANVDALLNGLIHSALTRRHYLRTVGARGLSEPRFLRASFIDPVLDAMAARQWKLVTEIVGLSARQWLEGYEYEDDFCYAVFLQKASGDESTDIEELFARWEEVLEGAKDARLEVARALMSKSTAAFETALRSLLKYNEERAKEMADPTGGSILSSDYSFFPNRWVSIEGLALLALAERLGIVLDSDFSACPRIVRTASLSSFKPVAYPNEEL